MPDTNQSDSQSAVGGIVIQTVARNFAVRMVTWVLASIGAALVQHGLATNAQVGQAVDPLAQIVVGGAFSLAAAGWAAWRASRQRQREMHINNSRAGAVPVK